MLEDPVTQYNPPTNLATCTQESIYNAYRRCVASSTVWWAAGGGGTERQRGRASGPAWRLPLAEEVVFLPRAIAAAATVWMNAWKKKHAFPVAYLPWTHAIVRGASIYDVREDDAVFSNQLLRGEMEQGSRFWYLLSETSIGLTALLSCALLPRQSGEIWQNSLPNLAVHLILSLSISLDWDRFQTLYKFQTSFI